MANATPIKNAAPVQSNIGSNIDCTVEGNIMTLRVDLSKRQGPSASGKTIIVATSAGNVAVTGGNGVVIGFNAYVKP